MTMRKVTGVIRRSGNHHETTEKCRRGRRCLKVEEREQLALSTSVQLGRCGAGDSREYSV